MPALRIAIAEDDRIARFALEHLLEKLGHEVVVSAETGQSLIAGCASTEPDVVITDNLMPDINGIDAAEQIYQHRPVPIILLSAYCDRELVLNAEQKHVLVYLVKPICEAHLEAALARCQSEWNEIENSDFALNTEESLVESAISSVRSRTHVESRTPPRPR